jgi:hypothetical protein
MNYLPSRHYSPISEKGLNAILLRVDIPRSNNILIKQSRSAVQRFFFFYMRKIICGRDLRSAGRTADLCGGS